MLCACPTEFGGKAAACGVCFNCRINKRRVWAHRMVLESLLHRENAFVTLTYRPEEEAKLPGAVVSIPSGLARVPARLYRPGYHVIHSASLEPAHLTAFLKRLRKEFSPRKVRYFGVGEYGDTNSRPHFHLAMFGLPTCRYARSQYDARKNCCEVCDAVRDAWGLGRVHLDTLNATTAAYVAGYVTKKLTKKGDPRLAGRHPEFARMSLKPGIGARYMDGIAPKIFTQGRHYLDAVGDVPTTLGHSGKQHPIGRYLKERLRARVLQAGYPAFSPPAETPQAKARAEEVQALWRLESSKTPLKVTLKDALQRAYKGKRDAFQSREKIAKKGRLL